MNISLNKTIVAAMMMAAAMASCGSDDDNSIAPGTDPTSPETPDQPATPEINGDYTQQYRPQIHYTPAKNWINDPNGMVYLDGTYHLFYQYNPFGNDWGNMSWGHATSTDLIHWQEQQVAITKTPLGDIFSGSCVIDKDNTAGFGKNAMVAIYTANGDKQQQAISYSTDGGMTFNDYGGNPVIGNTSMPDFRDPKVFWHEESKQWIMSLAKGWEYAIDFYASPDLKNWSKLSSFTCNAERTRRGQWECPDLIRMKVENGQYKGQEKWVLIVSVNPGGPTQGSGTMYFVGDFDGKAFTSNDDLSATGAGYAWIDYGMDNYAGVTWSNVSGRCIFLGWMNNWLYSGNVPCSPWRSAMTLPRELSLVENGGKLVVASKVVKEIDNIAGNWTDVANGQSWTDAKAYHLQVTLSSKSAQTVTLSNDAKQSLELTYSPSAKKFIVKRNASCGDVSFNGTFSIPSIQAQYATDADSFTLDIYIDQSSVEIFTGDGVAAITNLVFPKSIYNQCTTTGTAKVRTLSSIWTK